MATTPRPADVIPRILFAGGGTGGHVYPAIAIADALRQLVPRIAIEFAGTRNRMEWQAVPQAGYAIHAVTVSGFQRSLSLRNLAFPFRLARGLFEAWRIVKGFDPHVVVGTGGYVSGPVLWAAGMQKRTTILQEQNAYAGVTNRMLAKKAARIHIAFEEAKRYLPAAKCVLSGNPVRKNLMEAGREEARRHFSIPSDAKVLLVFGGSLGSPVLNSALKTHIGTLLQRADLHVIWQTGSRHFAALKEEVAAREQLRLLEYLDRMDLAYAASDLVLCRAGAITCSELLATGSPAVLVPSPHLAEDHQTKNAMAMERQGAARVLRESDLDENLVPVLTSLLDNQEALAGMSESARRHARPEAAETIADDILQFARAAMEKRHD